MSNSPGAVVAADGVDRHQRRLDDARVQGPAGVAAELGDLTHLLISLLAHAPDVFDPDASSSADLQQLTARIHELRCVTDALEAHSTVALTRSTRREETAAARDDAAQEADATPPADEIEQRADRMTRREISLTTRRSPHSAGQVQAASRRLVDSMPHILDALTRGLITAPIAHAVADVVAPLDPAGRRQVDRILGERLPDLDAAGTRRWRREVAAVIAELDPEGAERRHGKARRDRHVGLRTGEHGMSTLSLHLPALDAALVHKRLSLEAERRRAEGGRQGHSATMADALVDTVLGREDAMDPLTLDIGVMITERSLLTPDHGDVAHIEGYGPVPPETIRAEVWEALRAPGADDEDPCGPDGPAVRAVMRRIYTHPTTGELVAVESRAREFPRAMAHLLRWRDSSCRGPHCNAMIRASDHIRPHAAGGHTYVDNGQGLCALCNQKEQDSAGVERAAGPGHRVAWSSRSGTTRITTADRLAPPAPPPAPPPRASPPSPD